MIELKDNLNWHTFMGDLRPDSFSKRRQGESTTDWIKRIAIKDSGWLEKAKERERNDYWSEASYNFCFAVLSFMRRKNIKKEDLEEQLNLDLDLSGSYNWRMSEMEKIKNFMKNYGK